MIKEGGWAIIRTGADIDPKAPLPISLKTATWARLVHGGFGRERRWDDNVH